MGRSGESKDNNDDEAKWLIELSYKVQTALRNPQARVLVVLDRLAQSCALEGALKLSSLSRNDFKRLTMHAGSWAIGDPKPTSIFVFMGQPVDVLLTVSAAAPHAHITAFHPLSEDKFITHTGSEWTAEFSETDRTPSPELSDAPRAIIAAAGAVK